MDILSVIEGLNEDNLSEIYLLHGKERFLIGQLVARIKRLVLQGPMSEFNSDSLRAGKASGEEIVSRAREIPMMASRRLLLVEDGHKLNADDLAALDPYMASPSPETCLVVVADKLDLRRGPISRANKRGQVHKAEPLKDRGIGPFLRSRAKARHVSITPGALSALAAAVGPDCAALDDSLERLGLYAGPDNTVNEEDVAEVVTFVRERSIFELVDAIGNHKPSGALTVLEDLLSRREEPLRINAMVARHFRLLLGARIQLYRGTAEGEMASLLGVPPFVARKLIGQARRFRGAQLEGSIARLSHVDLELKSSRRPGRLVIERAVLDLCL